MNKMMVIMATIIGLGLGYNVAHSCPTEAMASGGPTANEVNNLVGTRVRMSGT